MGRPSPQQPRAWPRYNGALERAPRDVVFPATPVASFNGSSQASLLTRQLNHAPRPVLGGASPRQCFAARTPVHHLLTRTERTEIKRWIDHRRTAILTTMKGDSKNNSPRAYRRALQSVLTDLGILTVQNHA